MTSPSILNKQMISIPFSGGLDTITDPKQVLAGNLIDSQNVQFTKNGLISKRYGYTALGMNIEGGGTIVNGAGLAVYNEELVLFDNTYIYTFLQSTGTWVNKGIAISLIATDKQIIRRSDSQQLNGDVGYLNGIQVYAYEDQSRGGARYSVLDTQTQAFAVNDRQLASAGIKPKVIVFNNLIYLFTTDTHNNIYFQTINVNNPTNISNNATIVTDGLPSFSYDVCVSGGNLYLAYLANDAGPSINLLQLLPNGTISYLRGIATGETAYDGVSAINVVGDSDNNIWVSWSNGAAVYTSAYHYGQTTVLSATLVASGTTFTLAGIESINPGILQLTYENTIPTQRVTTVTINPTGVIQVVGNLLSVGLASKPFRTHNNICINLAYPSPLQPTYFTVLLNPQPFTVIGKIADQVGGGLRTNRMLSEVPTIDTNVFVFANCITGQVLSENQVNFCLLGINGTTLDFQHPNRFQSVINSNNLLIVGAVLQCYDGASTIEQGYHYYPEAIFGTPSGSDGALSDGVYQYQACFEWQDYRGQWQRSSPSTIATITVAAGNHVQLTGPMLNLTAKQTPQRANVSIVIYRTAANGVVFNQVTSTENPLLNDTQQSTWTYTDYLSDAEIASNPFIYTTGGVLNNDGPPACTVMSLYQDRVMISGLDIDPNLIWFSQNRFDNSNFNTLSTEFASELTIGVDARGGPVTAIFLIGQNLLIFKETATFILQGDGPNNLATGDTFPDAQMIAANVGTVEPQSVVVVPSGVMFKSAKGFYLIDTGFNFTWIGDKVVDYNRYTVVGAENVPNTNQVVFVTDTGPALVYDFYMQKWTIWNNHQAQASVVWMDTFCILKPNGQVWQQDQNSFVDGDGSPVYLDFTTPDFKLAQLSGYQRCYHVYINGTYKGPHILTVKVAYNDSPNYTTIGTLNINFPMWGTTETETLWGVVASDNTANYVDLWGAPAQWINYVFRLDPKLQRCTSIRFQISDSQTQPYNEGFNISGISLQIGTDSARGVLVPPSAIFGTT